MTYDIHSLIIHILIGLTSIGLLIHAILYIFTYSYILRNARRIKNAQKKKKKQSNRTVEQEAEDEKIVNNEKSGVSVVICAKNEEKNIRNFLPLVLEQDYDPFEVIIVNDGSVDDTVDVIRNFQKDYDNLYVTHLPQETRIISHKKLAITLGVKAAKYEYLLFIDADCRPLTQDWISEMVSHFKHDTEFVLGYGAYYQHKGFVSTLTSYDSLLTAMRYMGFASAGHPYMGVGRNMAYRKSTFMRNKGFAGFLHIASGDDDLLINRFGTKHNVEISSTCEAETLSIPKETMQEWFLQKRRHLSTSGVYKHKSKLLVALEPASTAILYLSAIALTAIGYKQNWILYTSAGALTLKYLIQYIVVNSTARYYKQQPFGLSLILCDIFLPLISLWYLIDMKFFAKRHRITWK